jgi:hypothetical protein
MSMFSMFHAKVALVGLALLAGACTQKAAPADSPAARIERGRVLVSIGGCNDCHTPMKFDPEIGMPIPDMSRMLSGHPEGAPEPSSTLGGHDQAAIGPTFTSYKLPFGIVFTANLTPDAATGLGNWTEEMFVRAVRTGRHMGGNGRPILPPMPWPNVGMQSDADLKSIWAYLRSIPAVHNDVPTPKVPDAVMDAIAASYGKMAARAKAGTVASR